MPVRTHTHKYLRVDIGVNKVYLVYKCVDPEGCPKPGHYLLPQLVVGVKTVCWRCGKDRVMTNEMARRAKPVCGECRIGSSPELLNALEEGFGVGSGELAKKINELEEDGEKE